MKTRDIFSLSALALGLAMAGLLTAAPAAPQRDPAPQGGGYADPEDDPQGGPMADIEPVYREPSIDTLATIRKRGELRVGVALTEPLVMHQADGELVGFSIDLGRQLAEDLGVEVRFVETSWAGIIPDLLDRHFDLIASGLWITPARALVVNFSDPTTTEGIYLIAGKPLAAGMTTRESFDRPEARIAVFAGTIQERVAEKMFPHATLVKVEGDEDQMAPVIEGKAHAALVPTFAPGVIVQTAPDKLFLPLDGPVKSTVTSLGVRKGDPDFLNFLNSWLTVQRDDGWLDERTRHWAEAADQP